MSEEEFPELAAIVTLLKALQPLKEDERTRVVGFVFQKLGMIAPLPNSLDRVTEQGADLIKALGTKLNVRPDSATEFTDIRSLKDAKNPSTASQMVALVAYYLEHLAPEGERREFVTADDIKPYFNQAGFELPSAAPGMTLTHAKNAGYLNALARGQYRLNPVGHNLVAYKLPADRAEGKVATRPRKKVAKGKKIGRKTGKRK
jgi:hypothetical protein